jgi:hypothetical protein
MSRTLLLSFLAWRRYIHAWRSRLYLFHLPYLFNISTWLFLGLLVLIMFMHIKPIKWASYCLPFNKKASIPDPTCNTTFVVLRNGLPRRRGTSSLWPMYRMTKSVGMYVSQILTKMSLATPSGFRDDWSAISSLKFVVDKGPPKIL